MGVGHLLFPAQLRNSLSDDVRDPTLSTVSFTHLLKTRLFSEYLYIQCIIGITLYALYKFTYLRCHSDTDRRVASTHIMCVSAKAINQSAAVCHMLAHAPSSAKVLTESSVYCTSEDVCDRSSFSRGKSWILYSQFSRSHGLDDSTELLTDSVGRCDWLTMIVFSQLFQLAPSKVQHSLFVYFQ